MKRFTRMFHEVDATTRTNSKIAALKAYFQDAPDRDAAWAVYFLLGNKLPRSVTTRQLRLWAAEASGLPEWLMSECHDAVGDLAETLALVLQHAFPTKEDNPGHTWPLHHLVETMLLPLSHRTPASRRELLLEAWRRLSMSERFVFNKFLTGNFRFGVARTLVARALAQIAGVPQPIMLHRLMGDWKPTPESYRALISGETNHESSSQPYPFYLASPLSDDPASLGSPADWRVEWKWDGIRAQLLRRPQATLLWSRGEELVTDAFPEITRAASALPQGTVLDGEILAWRHEAPLPFAQLQRRLGRSMADAKLQRQIPVIFMAYDLLEYRGLDCRQSPLSQRRSWLEQLMHQTEEKPPQSWPATTFAMAQPQGELAFMERFQDDSTPKNPLRLSPIMAPATWNDVHAWHGNARKKNTEGIMLKQGDSPYGVGRQRGAWWKWKVDPFTIDAVLVAAQPGHGRRASLFTDYTFAVWQDGELVTVAKAYSGLTDQEIRQVDAYVRQNTTGRFGPVRTVKAELVFELAFEGIRPSARHKAGFALRFPRMQRWRHDKGPEEADDLQHLRELLASNSQPTSLHL